MTFAKRGLGTCRSEIAVDGVWRKRRYLCPESACPVAGDHRDQGALRVSAPAHRPDSGQAGVGGIGVSTVT